MPRIRKFLLVFSVPVVTPALELSEISTEGGGGLCIGCRCNWERFARTGQVFPTNRVRYKSWLGHRFGRIGYRVRSRVRSGGGGGGRKVPAPGVVRGLFVSASVYTGARPLGRHCEIERTLTSRCCCVNSVSD